MGSEMCIRDSFSGGLVDALMSVPGIVVAGGSVVGALCDIEAGDLDLFCVGASPRGEDALRAVLAAVQQSQGSRCGAKSRLLVTRSRAAVTIFRACGGGQPDARAPPVQVVTTTYTTVQKLLLQFDVDSCCFAWVPSEDRVVTTARGLRALRYGANIADTRFDGPGYCRRLEKYADRTATTAAAMGMVIRMVTRLVMLSAAMMMLTTQGVRDRRPGLRHWSRRPRAA